MICFKKSPKSFYDSINLEIPDENTKRFIINKMNFISNGQFDKNSPIISLSPKNNEQFDNKMKKKIETLMSFQNEQIKTIRSSSSKTFENLCNIGDVDYNSKLPLNLKGSNESKQSFSNFLYDVSDSLEKKSKSLFYRNKTPEFAKCFQKNLQKEQVFFKFLKPKQEFDQPLIISKDNNFCENVEMNHFSEFSEKQTEEEYDLNLLSDSISKEEKMKTNQNSNQTNEIEEKVINIKFQNKISMF